MTLASRWLQLNFIQEKLIMDKDAILKILNRIMELELAGVVRYTTPITR